MLAGVAVCASIVGGATSLLSDLDVVAQAHKQKQDSISQYLQFRKVPKELRIKIRGYYKFLWATGQTGHHKELFNALPEALSVQLNLALKRKLVQVIIFVITI
jgi:hypothetical protein